MTGAHFDNIKNDGLSREQAAEKLYDTQFGRNPTNCVGGFYFSRSS
jgi:hypothetical protein